MVEKRNVRIARSALVAAGSALVALGLFHCGADAPPVAEPGDFGGGLLTGPCPAEGTTRSCHAVVAQREGFVDCFEGQQQCLGGQWSPCDGNNGGTLATRAYSGGALERTSVVVGGGLHALALSDAKRNAAACAANPCNPYCVGYDEVPSTPVGPTLGCAVTITVAGVTRICGNGAVETGEQCDDGNSTAGDGCNAGCQLEPGFFCPTPGSACVASVCGNGVVEGLEQCDDGPWAADSTGIAKDRPYDGCYGCKREVKCPVGAGTAPTPCESVCGDGLVFPGEDCDDGNVANGDGCSSSCKVEPGSTCVTITAPQPPFIDVPVIYRDRKTFGGPAGANASPDFQMNVPGVPDRIPHLVGGGGGSCAGRTIATQGMLQVGLSTVDRQPLFLNGKFCIRDAASFDTWFHDDLSTIPVSPLGINRLILGKFIRLQNQGGTPTTFVFDSSADPAWGLPQINCGTTPCKSQSPPGFYPINGLGFGNEVVGNLNHSFTDEARFAFTYSGGETLSFVGDDDLWVYIGGRKVVDIGNLHTPHAGSVSLPLSGSVSTIGPGAVLDATSTPSITLEKDKTYEIAIFGAERNSIGSNYKLTLGGFTRKISSCSVPTTVSISPPSTPTSYSQTYQTTGCQPGTVGQWNSLAYNVKTPQGTEIKLSVQTSADGVAGTWQPVTGTPAGVPVADIPLTNPGGDSAGAPSCRVNGPSPCGNNCASAIGAPMTSACPTTCSCPIDLFGALSAAPNTKRNAQQPFIQLNASLLPNGSGSCAGVLSPGLLSAPNGINSCVGPKAVVTPGQACKASTQYTDCDQDYHCDLVPGSPTFQTCIWNNGPNVWIDPACFVGGQPGFDLSIEAGCIDGSGGVQVPICNRGGATIPAGQPIEIWTDNSGGGCTKACTGSAVGKVSTCSYTLPNPLRPGSCINIPPSAGCTLGTGERCMQVNPFNTVVDVNGNKECNSIPNGTTWPTNGIGAGCNNNNAAVKATPSTCAACAPALTGTSAVPSISSWQVTFSCVPNE